MTDDCTGVPDLLDRLGGFVAALDRLLDRTGPNGPNGFEAAIRNAEREHWADDEARKTWDAMLGVRHAHGRLSWPVLFSVNFFSVELGDAVERDLRVPLERARAILEDAWTRWGMDSLGRWRTDVKTRDFQIADGICWLGEHGGRKDDVWRRYTGDHFEIPAPVLETAEHEALSWVRDALIRARDRIAETFAPIVCPKSTLLLALKKHKRNTPYLDKLREDGKLEFNDPPIGPNGKPMSGPIAFRFTDTKEHREMREKVRAIED